ncbi:MAG: chromosome segregation protein SMC [Microthrixaceae bacterium]
MFLKSLQLKGFKSFADSTTLAMEPGVTVVVGPNGSGKSNVVDAIGWVLGAQAPSAVRSAKMDDVIFAGADNRSALGRAEVSLTIDNSAGMLPIEFAEVTIKRVLFRSGDSEYSINGASCRLLDIQDLLSDSGVGRTQHVIISQGQIDAVLNAKAEDRRAIIEEAAGILKHRKRKERAERRLTSTEANLNRVGDLLREVKRQLRPLERQADAARRHGDLTAELAALRIHLLGKRLSGLRRQLAERSADGDAMRAEDQRLRAALADLDARVVAAEANLSALGEVDQSGLLTRYEALRERARGQGALLAERRRNLARERESFIDEGVIAALEAEGAQLDLDLAGVDSDTDSLGTTEAEWRRAEEALAAARADFEAEWGDGVPKATGDATAARAELAGLLRSIEQQDRDGQRLAQRRDQLAQRRVRLTEELEAAQAQLATDEDDHEAAVGAAEARLEAAKAAMASAEAEARAAADERSSWTARATALGQALDAARSRAGAEALAEVDGFLGTLLDLVEVDAGWEAAFEAAAGDSLAAVVMADPGAARRALAQLTTDGGAGAVLALGSTSGTVAHSALPGTTLVGDHVRPKATADAAVGDLLASLLGDAVSVSGDWNDAVDVALANPSRVVVTGDGDRFGRSGWRVGTSTTEATGAALEEAEERAEQARRADEQATAALAEAKSAANEAEADLRGAERARDQAASSRRSARERAERSSAALAESEAEAERLEAETAELAERSQADEAQRLDLEKRLPGLEAEEAHLAEREAAHAEARARLDERAGATAALRRDLEVRAAGVEERRRMLVDRRVSVRDRLERNRAEAAAAAERRVELDARAEATERLATFVAKRLAVVEADLVGVREARRHQSEQARAVTGELEALRAERTATERSLSELSERRHQAEVADAELRLRLETLTEQARTELEVEPEVAEAAPAPEVPEGVSAAEHLRVLERELRLMGPINPLALAEFAELSERHEFLQAQLEDVRSSRRELAKIIKAVDDEIISVFAAAYADVAGHFESLFSTLFPGGEGALSLTDPNDLLNTGIELKARPSGKNVRKLSLLSGGERSLTALAYLFAVFRSRPSPFYVMDEVEAALDDVNLHRFLDLVAEFRDAAQLIIVSHQKRTMEAADVLYGVTMEPGGSSKVLSEKRSAG